MSIIRWGLLSTARINERLIPILHDSSRSELVGVASSQGLDQAQSYADRWKIARAYGSYPELLEDPHIDAVYVSLPNALHAEWAVRAAQAGKHVLCEKPLALTVDEVTRMSMAARENDVRLFEGTMMRYHAQTRQLRQLVADRAIGDLRSIQATFAFTLKRHGDIRFDPTVGGGSLWDLGGYCVSLMRCVLDEEPTHVHGWQTTGETGVDLTFAGHLQFASGVFGQFCCSFDAAAETRADILGTHGMMHLDLPFANRVDVDARLRVLRESASAEAGTFSDLKTYTEEVFAYPNINAYRDEVLAVEACLVDGGDPVISAVDSIAQIATVRALYESASTGRVVTCVSP